MDCVCCLGPLFFCSASGHYNAWVGMTRVNGVWYFTDGSTKDFTDSDEVYSSGPNENCARFNGQPTPRIVDQACSSGFVYQYICMIGECNSDQYS